LLLGARGRRAIPLSAIQSLRDNVIFLAAILSHRLARVVEIANVL
jgi:hypothetical protein